MDLSIVSDKAKLSVNNYRQLPNGTVHMANMDNFKDSKTSKQGEHLLRAVFFPRSIK